MENNHTDKPRMSRREALRIGTAAAITTAALGSSASGAPSVIPPLPMANIEFHVKTYRVYHYSGYSYESLIMIDSDSAYTGFLYFKKDGQALPSNFSNGNSVYSFFPISRMNEILSTLRYDGPLYIGLATNGVFSFSTFTDEPAGEQEI